MDQAGSLRRQTSAITGWDETASRRAVHAWLTHVAEREREIITGDTAFVPSHVLDAEALENLATKGVLPAADDNFELYADDLLHLHAMLHA